jgi:diacylglycerol kinase (ATP)
LTFESIAMSRRHAFVVLNPRSGGQGQTETFRRVLARSLPQPDWICEILETDTGQEVAALCRSACEHGASIVIAAGGDGTLASIGSGLVGSGVPLGIVPLGTGNDLARALRIPLNVTSAVALLAGEHSVLDIDVLQVGERAFFSNVSVGITPQVVRDADSKHKKFLGRLAYVYPLMRGEIVRRHPFRLTLDGDSMTVRASEVMLSNETLLENPPAIFGPPETLSDGRIEVYILTARSLGEYVRLIWKVVRRSKGSSGGTHLTARHVVRVETDLPRRIQADGELIGTTPVEVRLLRKVVRVIVPNETAAAVREAEDAGTDVEQSEHAG